MRLAVVVVPIALAACSGESGPDRDADRAAIGKTRAAFLSAYNVADADAAIQAYEPDAVLMLQHQKALVGREAIQGFWQAAFSQFQIHLKVTEEELLFTGDDWAFERSRYELLVQPREPGKPVEDRGKFVVLWHRQKDGSWKMARDIDNSDAPLPNPAE